MDAGLQHCIEFPVEHALTPRLSMLAWGVVGLALGGGRGALFGVVLNVLLAPGLCALAATIKDDLDRSSFPLGG